MKSNRLAFSGLYLLFTILNTLVGILVAIMLMAGDFFTSLFGEQQLASLSQFDLFFLSYILHPATGIVYVCLLAALVVYQTAIAKRALRLSAHIAMLVLSGLIVLESALLVYQF